MKKPNHNLIYEYRLPYGPLCSPTGRFAAYGVKQAVQEANRYSLQIHVLDLKTGEDQVLNKTWNCPFYFWTCQGELLLGKKEGGETFFMKWAPDTEEVTFSFRIHGNCVGAKPLRGLEDGLEDGLKSGQTSAGGEEILFLIRENVNPVDLHKKSACGTPNTASFDPSGAESTRSPAADSADSTAADFFDSPVADSTNAPAANSAGSTATDSFDPSVADSTSTYTVIDELPYWSNGAGFTVGVRNRLYLYREATDSLLRISGETDDVTLYEADRSAGEPCILYAACRFDGCYDDKPGIYWYHIRSQATEVLLEPGIYYVRLLCSTKNFILFSGSKGETYGKYQYDGFYKLAGRVVPKYDNQMHSDQINDLFPMNIFFTDDSVSDDFALDNSVDDNYIIDNHITDISVFDTSASKNTVFQNPADRESTVNDSVPGNSISGLPASCSPPAFSWKLLAKHEASAGLCSIISDTLTGMGQKTKVIGNSLYFLSTVNDRCGIHCLDAKSGLITEIPTGCTAVESFDMLSSAGEAPGTDRNILICGTAGNFPSELYLLSSGGAEVLRSDVDRSISGSRPRREHAKKNRLTFFQRDLETSFRLSDREELTFINSDGIMIRGWVMRPLEAEKSPGLPAATAVVPASSARMTGTRPGSAHTGCAHTGFPAIFCIHGGPRSVYGDVYYHEMQLLAAAGYFVCFYNGRGSDSRGNPFGDINGKYGKEDMKDLMEFADRVLLRYPEIDPRRLGLSGGSYGGYLVNWVLGHSSRFAAAVSQRSISNWITQEALSDIGYYYVPDQAKASLLNNEAGRLWENSPLKYAGQIETPLLLLHSDEDKRCGLPEAQQMFYVLKRRKIPCRLVIFHGENHELNKNGKPANRIARIRMILEWMDRYL